MLFSQVTEIKEKASHFENHFRDLSNSARNQKLQTVRKKYKFEGLSVQVFYLCFLIREFVRFLLPA